MLQSCPILMRLLTYDAKLYNLNVLIYVLCKVVEP